MNKSETVMILATALAKAQGEMKAAQMNATNPFLKNKYADLGAIIEAAKPTLAKYGLSVSQMPTSADDRIGVTTILLHESGEWLEDTITLPLGDERGKSLAQVAGSIITYLRRYSLASVIGMYADEDADGNTGKPAEHEHPQEAKPEPANGHKVERPMNAQTLKNAISAKSAKYAKISKPCTQGARGILVSQLEGLFDGKDHTEKQLKRYRLTKYLVGNSSTKDISDADANALLDWVQNSDPADAKAEAEAVLNADAVDADQQTILADLGYDKN